MKVLLYMKRYDFVIGSECAKCIHLECPIQIVTGPGMDKMVFV